MLVIQVQVIDINHCTPQAAGTYIRVHKSQSVPTHFFQYSYRVINGLLDEEVNNLAK